MEFLPLIFTFLFLLFCYLFHRSKQSPTRRKPPQASGAWPIIGHMPLLGGGQLLHKTLATLADKHGPVYTIKVGSHEVLAINNSETAKECFTTHDRIFSDRPAIAASNLLGYNLAMFGFAPYGPYWRHMRKIATLELLSNHRIENLKETRVSEIETAVKQVYKQSGVVDMKKWFGDLTGNIAVRMVGGKRIFGEDSGPKARRCRDVMREYMSLFGVFVVSDYIPFLGWLDLNGYKKRMKSIAQELDGLMGIWLDEHKRERSKYGGDKKEQDFMDGMLNILENEEISGFDADTVIKATCLNMLLAVTDTTTVTLTWTLSLLLNNPQHLDKAKTELDIHVGKDRIVEETDLKNLVYLQAIIKESMRLYPPTRVIGLRSSMEDCTLETAGGYHVPARTRLMVNVWRIQRDERIWSNPDKFDPERFLERHKKIDLKGQSFELFPFGSGRRSCPGIALGLRVVEFTLATLLHSFDVFKVSSEDVDMTESSNLTNLKATPLEVRLVPRLHPKLYNLQ